MFVVYWLLLKIVCFIALECLSMLYVCVRGVMDVVFSVSIVRAGSRLVAMVLFSVCSVFTVGYYVLYLCTMGVFRMVLRECGVVWCFVFLC